MERYAEGKSESFLHSVRQAVRASGEAIVVHRPALVLDRFLVSGKGICVDLATGLFVQLRRTAAGDGERQRRRSTIGSVLAALRIPGMATLVDFGPDGRDRWVEAYAWESHAEGLQECGSGDPSERERQIAGLLRAAGLRVVRRAAGGPAAQGPPCPAAPAPFVPVPCRSVDLDADGLAEPEATPPGCPPALGTSLQRRDELDHLSDVVEAGRERGLRVMVIEAPVGAGLRVFANAAAAEARRAGFVPVCGRLLAAGSRGPGGFDTREARSLLAGRHLFILDVDRVAAGRLPPVHDAAGLGRLLGWLPCEDGRAHLLLTTAGAFAGARVPSIALGPLRPEALRRSVLLVGLETARVEEAVAGALDQSGGLPGAFQSALHDRLGLRRRERPYPTPRPAALFVREGHAPVAASRADAATGTCTTSALARADALARRGRHAAAERLLKRTAGFLERRRSERDAARVHLAIGRLHAARGRREAARTAFETSRRLCDAAGDVEGVVRALLHLGAVLVDDGALQAAESVLRTAAAGARAAGIPCEARAAGLLLAKCLFWQGSHRTAWRMAEDLHGEPVTSGASLSVAERPDSCPGTAGWGPPAQLPGPLPPGVTALHAEIGVRTALREHDGGLAARRLAAAGGWRESGDPAHLGSMCSLSVLVQGALGDAAGVMRDSAEGLQVLRQRHAPGPAQELRLARVEALIGAGDCPGAAAELRRLTGRRSGMPAGLARARLDDLAGRLQGAPAAAGEPGSHVDCAAVVQILQRCQDADDDQGALAGVCQSVRAALDAAAVSAFQLDEGPPALAANDGGRPCRVILAERAAAAGLSLGPDPAGPGREAAAPVRYGGRVVGVLAARWTADTALDAGRVRGVLAAAAAAVAPALAAVAAKAGSTDRDSAAAGELTGTSDAMAALRRQVARAAAAPFPVLVEGESGTGKELIARAIHAGSLRRHRRFCAINCAALSDDLFETELFGHARGAFTGAASDRQGLFEAADGGTLFLDEVGELSPRAQAKLLRAIQEGEVRRVGENHARRVDARIVAATNRPLGDEARAGRFRHDLLFRLDVVRIVVPPLRDRREDIAPLARLFWREATARLGGRAELSPAAVAALGRYDWPGNVRELQNTLAALAVHAPPRGRVGPSSLPLAIAGAAVASAGEPVTLDLARRRFEARFVRSTLARTGGRRAETAAALGLTRQGLTKLMARLGIDDAAESRETAY